MKIHRKRRFHAEVSTHSLNDIMFFLLLFFLIVSTIANPNVIKLFIPKTSSEKPAAVTPSTLTVTPDKRFYLDQNEVSFETLESKLIAKANGNENFSVILRVPHDLLLQDLVDVMQIGTRNKFKMVLAADRK